MTAEPLTQDAPSMAAMDPRHPLSRLAQLLDPGSLRRLGLPAAGGTIAVTGLIAGAPVTAFCTDATHMGGALGAEDCDQIVAAVDLAARDGRPVVGLWHSGGARLGDGVESMHGAGLVFQAMTRASGRVPQISVVLGPAAGAAAYGPALTDIVVMATQSRMFVTGPDVVRTVTGEDLDMEALGGASVHSRRSGVAHVVAESEAGAYRQARALVELFARPGRFDLSTPSAPDLQSLLPTNPRRAYDVHPLILALVDPDSGLRELQPHWAPNLVVGLARLGGRTVGVVANNPLRKGGCLDSLSAEKGSRFVRMCDALGVPLVVLVDVPGYLPGATQEWNGVIRRGAKLLHAFAEATVPRVTLVTRKAYGGAYIAMNSRSLGATAVFAWPDAEVAVMGAEAAVNVLRRRELAAAPDAEQDPLRRRFIEEHERDVGGLHRAVDLGVVDAVIEPATSRQRIIEALASAPAGRGTHTNIPL